MTSTHAGRDDRPIEEVPTSPGTLRLWALLLAGPVLWITHFMVVYLFSEAACVARESEGLPVPGSGAIVPIVVLATVVAAAVTTLTTGLSWRVAKRTDGDESALASAGALLGALSVVAIVAVGLPALVLHPC